jgi:mannose-6-phosphate isomerase-like protein (cupin superfamily)
MADLDTAPLDDTDRLGVTGLHFHLLDLAPGARGEPEHEGEEEVYVVLGGDGTLHAGQDELALRADTVVRVGAAQGHHVVAGAGGLRLLAVATRPGRAYDTDAGRQPEVGGG